MPTALTNTGNNDSAINSVRIDVARAGILSLIGLSNTDIADIEGTDRNAITRRLSKVPDTLYDVPASVLTGAVEVMNAVGKASRVLIVLMDNESTPASVRASVAFGIYDRSVGYIQQANKDSNSSKDSDDDGRTTTPEEQAQINKMALASATHIVEAEAERKRLAREAEQVVDAEVIEEQKDEKKEQADGRGDGPPPV